MALNHNRLHGRAPESKQIGPTPPPRGPEGRTDTRPTPVAPADNLQKRLSATAKGPPGEPDGPSKQACSRRHS